MIILIIHLIVTRIMTRIFHWFLMWKMDHMSGCVNRLVFTLLPKDSTLQYKNAYASEITFLALVPWFQMDFLDNISFRNPALPRDLNFQTELRDRTFPNEVPQSKFGVNQWSGFMSYNRTYIPRTPDHLVKVNST